MDGLTIMMEPLDEHFGPLERLLRLAHGTRSRAIRPRMPFTSFAASSVA